MYVITALWLACLPTPGRGRPEQTILYRLARQIYASFALEVEAHGAGSPWFVMDEFGASLDFGISPAACYAASFDLHQYT